MKYKITIQGGFAGVPKIYEGEHKLTEEEKFEIIKLMTGSKTTENTALRDGYRYQIELNYQHKDYKATFDDSNIPEALVYMIHRFKTDNG